MHSRIFHASETPLGDEELTEDDLADYQNTIDFDYVRESDRLLDDYEWAFGGPAFILARDEHGPYAEVRDKEAYFKPMYDEFRKALEKVNATTFEEFCDGNVYGRDYGDSLEYNMYVLRSRYEDKCAFWLVGIEYYGGYPIPLDHWMRHAKVGDRLYLGASFDYHFRARLGKPLRGAPPPISGYRYLSGIRCPLPPSPLTFPLNFTKNQRKGLYTTTVIWCSVMK